MIEIPEANNLARQIQETLTGKEISEVIAAASPHKFTWYHEDPQDYPQRLSGKTVSEAFAVGGHVQIRLGDANLLLSDGVNPRFLPELNTIPAKHQLLLTFSDGSSLVMTVQMYGGILCWLEGWDFDNYYHQIAKEKPSPLSDQFNETYFVSLFKGEKVENLSLKAALATEQHIPGLGNGVLQDILWNACLNPRKKVNTLSKSRLHTLFESIKSTLQEMTQLGGRNTEKDLFGNPGGYQVVMASKASGGYCPRCGHPNTKEAYMGGSVYYCLQCQPL